MKKSFKSIKSIRRNTSKRNHLIQNENKIRDSIELETEELSKNIDRDIMKSDFLDMNNKNYFSLYNFTARVSSNEYHMMIESGKNIYVVNFKKDGEFSIQNNQTSLIPSTSINAKSEKKSAKIKKTLFNNLYKKSFWMLNTLCEILSEEKENIAKVLSEEQCIKTKLGSESYVFSDENSTDGVNSLEIANPKGIIHKIGKKTIKFPKYVHFYSDDQNKEISQLISEIWHFSEYQSLRNERGKK